MKYKKRGTKIWSKAVTVKDRRRESDGRERASERDILRDFTH